MAVLRAALADVRARRGRLVEVVGEPGHRQVPAGRGAADRRRRRARSCARRARSTSRPRRTSRSGGCCARCSGSCPRTPAPSRSHGGSSTGSRSTRRTWCRGCRCSGIPLDLELAPTPETAELDEQFRKGRLEEVVADFLTWVAAHVHGARLRGRAPDGRRVRRPAAPAGAAGWTDRPWLVLVTRRDQHGRLRAAQPSPTWSRVRPAPLDRRRPRCDLVRARARGPPAAPSRRWTRWPRAAAATRCSSRRWSARRAGPARSADLPESVEGLVTSQIDRLDPADRTVLRYAAVLGMVVDEDALDSLLRRPRRATRRRHGALRPAGARSSCASEPAGCGSGTR